MQERFRMLILASLRYASVGFAVRLRIFELLSKILSLGNTQINLVFRSLIRTLNFFLRYSRSGILK